VHLRQTETSKAAKAGEVGLTLLALRWQRQQLLLAISSI